MIVKTIHSLEKVFFDRSPEPAEWSADVAARGEVYSFQVMLEPETMSERGVCRVAVQSELPVEVRLVQNVPVRQAVNFNPDDDFLRKEPGLYPDLLEELDEDRFQLFYGRQTLWVTVRVPENAAPEEYPVRFEFTRVEWPNLWNPDVVATAEFRLKVEAFTLPPQRLLRLEWFHADCLAAYYQVRCWSGEHWRIVEAFLRNAVRHGINCVYTPLWTPPLDTGLGGERPTCQLLDIEYDSESGYRFDFSKLERYLDLGLACGAERFAMSHFFTQWGARFTPKIVVREGGREVKRFGWHVKATDPAYREFLTALMPELLALLVLLIDVQPEAKALFLFAEAVGQRFAAPLFFPRRAIGRKDIHIQLFHTVVGRVQIADAVGHVFEKLTGKGIKIQRAKLAFSLQRITVKKCHQAVRLRRG